MLESSSFGLRLGVLGPEETRSKSKAAHLPTDPLVTAAPFSWVPFWFVGKIQRTTAHFGDPQQKQDIPILDVSSKPTSSGQSSGLSRRDPLTPPTPLV